MKEYYLVYFLAWRGWNNCSSTKNGCREQGRDWHQNFHFLPSERGVQVTMEPLFYLLVTTIDLRRCFANLRQTVALLHVWWQFSYVESQRIFESSPYVQVAKLDLVILWTSFFISETSLKNSIDECMMSRRGDSKRLESIIFQCNRRDRKLVGCMGHTINSPLHFTAIIVSRFLSHF